MAIIISNKILKEKERGWTCFHGWKAVVIKVEKLEAEKVRAQEVEVATMKSDGQIEETGLPVRGLMRVVLPQANVGECMAEMRDTK